jgi:peptidoglycan hydrolase-like protein with peptidoglycan-binding domain
MKTKMKPVLVLSIIFGFVLMLMNVSVASAQQQTAAAEKSAVKMETQTQAMQSSKPEAKMETSVAQSKKAASTMMKSTGKMPMMSNQEIKSVQEALNKDGYKLAADGILGKRTRGAIKEFQKKSDLKVTGRLDSETLAKLNLK